MWLEIILLVAVVALAGAVIAVWIRLRSIKVNQDDLFQKWAELAALIAVLGAKQEDGNKSTRSMRDG